jgi:Ca2+-binding RTX toxin-like protein
VLDGGAGNDVYTIRAGDGRDTIIDASGTDAIEFDASVALEATTLSLVDGNLVLSFVDGGSLTIDGTVEEYRFAHGTLTHLQMLARLSGTPEPGSGTTGTEGDDTLQGGSGADLILGLGSNDSVDGLAGDDLLSGDAGADTVHGGDGADKITGGDDADLLFGDAGPDQLWGQGGDDALQGGDGNDELNGGDGADLLVGGHGDDVLASGGTGDKTYTFEQGDGVDQIAAHSGARHIQFGAGIAPEDIMMFFSPAVRPSRTCSCSTAKTTPSGSSWVPAQARWITPLPTALRP